jgi:hypothetical protein
LPLRAEYPGALSPEARSLPILQVHGDEDMVVGFEWGKGSHELIKTMIPSPQPEFIKIEVLRFLAVMISIHYYSFLIYVAYQMNVYYIRVWGTVLTRKKFLTFESSW